MERFVTVNDFSGSRGPGGRFNAHPANDTGSDFEHASPHADWRASGSDFGAQKRPDQGPCLYLGPKGQRCGDPANAGGFCAKHDPDAAKAAAKGVARLVGAGIGILAAMWPILADVIRDVIRWIHSH
jgi:hypothetical protein